MVVVADYNFLSRVDDVSESDEVVELRVLARQPSLECLQVQLYVPVAGIPSGLFVGGVVFVVSCSSCFARPRGCHAAVAVDAASLRSERWVERPFETGTAAVLWAAWTGKEPRAAKIGTSTLLQATRQMEG